MEVTMMAAPRIALVVVVIVLLTCAGAAFGADNVYLFLKTNGTEVQGDSSVTSLGRENSIECFAFEFNLASPAGQERGKRPTIVVRKPIDKSTPVLARALSQNEIVEGSFRFYRPNPAGDGTTEQFFTVEISKGRITSIRYILPDTLDQDTAPLPAYEEVSLAFGSALLDYGGQVSFEISLAPVDASGEPTAAPQEGTEEPAATPHRLKLRPPSKPGGDG
jgi:type VI secretion system secreted protein Hcp